MAELQPQRGFDIPKPSAFSGNPRKKLLIIVGVVVFFCVCIGILFSLLGAGIGAITDAKAPIEQVIDTFMQRMEERNLDEAYKLFSERARRQISIDKLGELIEGNNYVLFSDYQRVEVGNVKITEGFNTNPDVPQGTVARVDGTVYYKNNIIGKFTATLEKEGDNWVLDGINITVPPDKFTP